MNVLVLGCSGMLGNAVFRILSADSNLKVLGTLRSASSRLFFRGFDESCLIPGVDVQNVDSLHEAYEEAQPDVVINCVGLIKQLAVANDPLQTLPINSMLPHRLARLCGLSNSRLVHVSTDCVFSGRKGSYVESDPSDAEDLYGKSKYLGELHDCAHAITLRTSIIGHEIRSSYALIDWFLAQSNPIKGYSRAIFSGLPTVELARVIKEHVLPNPKLSGLYHVSSPSISKLNLLKQVASQYKRPIEIIPDDSVVIDRSLVSRRFSAATGYQSPSWEKLVERMHSDFLEAF